MKRRRWIILCLASALVLLLSFALLRPEDDGPSYQGKTLLQWLAACDADNATEAEAQRAVDAVRHIGTNGLPFLLNRIQHEPPAWKKKLARFVPRVLWARVPNATSQLFSGTVWADDRADAAMNAFAILGQDATPAIPALTNLLSHQERWSTSLRALRALCYIGTNGPGITFKVATNTSYSPIHRFVALQSIATSGTNAICVVPALVDSLNNPDTGAWRRQIATTLGKLKLQPELTVPALAKCLSSEQPPLPETAAQALENFGPQATAAVPDLLVATTNGQADLRIAATRALLKIAPQALKEREH